MRDPEMYAANAIAMWSSIGECTETRPGVARVKTSRATRHILRTASAHFDPAELLAAEPPEGRVLIEDSFGSAIRAVPGEVEVKQMPVMVRPITASVSTTSAVSAVSAAMARVAGVRAGRRVVQVTGPDQLTLAQTIIQNGFPAPNFVLPEAVLGLAGWRVWLAYHQGVPAAAGYTYDDGTSSGVYLLATLPEQRGAGLGRAVMNTAIAASPDRPTVLVATDAGAPLYRRLGFVEVSPATWYIRAPA